MNNELLKQEERRADVMDYAKMLFRYGPPEQPQYNKQKINAFMVGYDHAAKQVKELFEAYNRECKRVDELTEEVGKGKELIVSLYERISEQHKRNEKLEGLLKDIKTTLRVANVFPELQSEIDKSI